MAISMSISSRSSFLGGSFMGKTSFHRLCIREGGFSGLKRKKVKKSFWRGEADTFCKTVAISRASCYNINVSGCSDERYCKIDEQGVSAVAEKKQTYKEVMAERDAYKHELDVMKQDRVNRQAKNSVFLNLFMRKEYQLQLYKELFPQDTTITEDDLEMITMDNVLTIHPYNDLGLLARGKLIVLAEAQST